MTWDPIGTGLLLASSLDATVGCKWRRQQPPRRFPDRTGR